MEDFGRRKEDWISADSPLLLGVITSDLKLKIINRTWERVLGYPRVTLVDKPLTRLVDQNEHAAALTLVNTRLAAVEGREIEFSLRCKDGTYRCFAWERRPARGEEGVFVTGRDVTERKKMETTANLQRYLQSKKNERPV
jgi:PAS domain S-box-containing protein